MKRLRPIWGAAALWLLLALMASPALAAPSHPYLFSIVQFIPKPNVIETFEGPCGVTVDSNGDLYVSDYYHDKIDVFGAGGNFLTSIDEVDPLDGPCGLAVDPAGSLFVNVLHRNVTRYSPSAFPPAPGTSYGSGDLIDPGHSTGVAVDPASGNVYVNDRSFVAVYEPSGAPVLDGGSPLRIGEGSLGDAFGVAVSGFPATAGYVYVADHATDVVKVYDPAVDPDTPIATIDGAGIPGGGFTTLRDASLALDDSTGHLFVVFNAQGPFYEHPRAAVAEFNAAGEYRGTLPTPTPLWFGEPSGIAVDNWGGAGQGRVYVTTGNSEVESAAVPPGQAATIKAEEGALYAFGPSAAGERLEVELTGGGDGTVVSTPAGIACPGACAAEYDEGAAVTLKATPAAGSTFAGWSGGCSGGGGCTVSLDAATSVTAEFAPLPSPLAPAAADAPPAPLAAAGLPGQPLAVPAGEASEAPSKARRQHRRHKAKGHRHRGRQRAKQLRKARSEGPGAKR